jgi:hypothetical protein
VFQQNMTVTRKDAETILSKIKAEGPFSYIRDIQLIGGIVEYGKSRNDIDIKVLVTHESKGREELVTTFQAIGCDWINETDVLLQGLGPHYKIEPVFFCPIKRGQAKIDTVLLTQSKKLFQASGWRK